MTIGGVEKMALVAPNGKHLWGCSSRPVDVGECRSPPKHHRGTPISVESGGYENRRNGSLYTRS